MKDLANELRIGNYARHGVDGVYEMTYERFRAMLRIRDRDLKPIPISEDWMLEFGAEKEIYEEGSDGYYLVIRREKFSIIWESDDNVYCDISENVFKLKYVHTMQNVYYALEGEELKIDRYDKNNKKTSNSTCRS